MSDGVYSELKNAVANDTKSAKKKNPKLKPSAAGSIWRRRSDEVNERWRLFGTKKRRRERYEVRDDVVVRMTIQNFSKNPVISMVPGLAG